MTSINIPYQKYYFGDYKKMIYLNLNNEKSLEVHDELQIKIVEESIFS
jgi:hypothetical protein